MSHKVLIHGATGETGGDIVDGLLEDGSFTVTALVRPQSVNKPAVQALQTRGISHVVADLATQSADEVAKVISGYDTIISTVGPSGQLDQLKLVDAAAKAGTVKRFVPCGYTTVSAPGGEMRRIRGDKEKVHQRIWAHRIPYTIIDSGYWYQISFPKLPSGRADYMVIMPHTTIYGDGNAPNLLVDKRDMGRLTARIIKDERTINKRVFMHADVLSQNEILAIMEKKSGEKIDVTHVSNEQAIAEMYAAREASAWDPTSRLAQIMEYGAEYSVSKFVKKDNTPEFAKYLGYLDTKELYPEFKPITFAEFADELLAGTLKRPYPDFKL